MIHYVLYKSLVAETLPELEPKHLYRYLFSLCVRDVSSLNNRPHTHTNRASTILTKDLSYVRKVMSRSKIGVKDIEKKQKKG